MQRGRRQVNNRVHNRSFVSFFFFFLFFLACLVLSIHVQFTVHGL